MIVSGGRSLDRDRGSATIWALAVGLVIVLFAVAMAEVGVAITARRSAQAAADLGALAGAARTIEGAAAACSRAAAYVAANGAELRDCRLDGLDLIVTAAVATRFGTATAAARAGPVASPSAA
ncbi:Rv3654c family TadE-like protein [Hamadaea sp. NPDC050747]|uniref:Rv3654c family TadE-like protein n=1 Tax=Hamadaea sp. NPDC050747 TaxID=3155789 RepID=UPI0033D44D40